MKPLDVEEEPYTLVNLRRALALLRKPNTPRPIEAALEDAIESFERSWREGAVLLTHDEYGVTRSHWPCPPVSREHPGT